MAIKVDIQNSQFGVPFQGAYFRIVTATVSRLRANESGEKFSVMIDVAGYATEPQNDDTREVDFRRYHAPYSEVASMPGANVFDWCYAWVMRQPDMAGSVGV